MSFCLSAIFSAFFFCPVFFFGIFALWEIEDEAKMHIIPDLYLYLYQLTMNLKRVGLNKQREENWHWTFLTCRKVTRTVAQL